jgi:CHAT domain-containing protein/tetratricopeptide (TPR) repeat protein
MTSWAWLEPDTETARWPCAGAGTGWLSPPLGTAAELYEDAGRIRAAVEVRRDASAAYAAVGDLDAALGELHRAEQTANEIGAEGSVMAELALSRADLALRFNRAEEAQREFVRAEVLFSEAGNDPGVVEARLGVGYLLLLQKEYSQASTVFESVIVDQTRSGDPRAAAMTRLLLGHARERIGDIAGARTAITDAATGLAELGDQTWAAASLSALGDLEARAGSTAIAESLYAKGLAQLEHGDAPDIRWRLTAGFGAMLARRGRLELAADQLNAAIAEIERVAATAGSEERRLAYLADKWEVYARLAGVELQRGDVAAAFEASERMRARRMLALLSRGGIPPAESQRSLVTAREQDLRLYLSNPLGVSPTVTTDATLFRDPGTISNPTFPSAGLADARVAHSQILEEVSATDPEYAELIAPWIVQVDEIASRLEGDEALLEYLVSDSTTLVFVVTADTVAWFDLGIGSRPLGALVDFARGTIAGPQGDEGLDSWKVPLRRLYRELIEPVENAGFLADKHRLRIVPHGELHYLPFQALIGPREDFLVERYVVSYIPSASVWMSLPQEDRRGENDRVLAMAPLVERIPASRIEVEEIGNIFGTRAKVLIGPAASEQTLYATAESYSILHFATLGLVNKANPLFSFVQLHSGGDDDGRLEVHEAFGLRLTARLVVLSACETGLGSGALADVPAGDDWVGLVRSFLYAGASNVLATLWRVEDLATARLMRSFYQSFENGRSSAEALALAQRALLGQPSTAHPFFWAGFMLTGSS